MPTFTFHNSHWIQINEITVICKLSDYSYSHQVSPTIVTILSILRAKHREG